jgi:CPA1 family monovalent cation:H+ antiporter
MFEVFIGLVAISALFSFINSKWIKLPETIGVMLLALLFAVLLLMLSWFSPSAFGEVCTVVEVIDFRSILFNVLLSFLLFAGAIHVDVYALIAERGPVIIYATIGVLVSTALIGTAFYGLVLLFGLPISYMYSLVFGALISPTDPIAVLALLKKAGAPKDLELKIVGESLFNDGVGIVVFLSLIGFATMDTASPEFSEVLLDLAQEAGGGLILGVLLTVVGRYLFKQIYEAPAIAVHLSIALVSGGYYLASVLEVSGALAMVVLGLGIGDYLHRQCHSPVLKEHMNIFWKVLDDMLNAILFVLLGIEVLRLEFDWNTLFLGLAAIPTVLLARFLTVIFSNLFLKKDHRSSKDELYILTWAGLRGAISIALALSLPDGQIREILLVVTYVITIFSIVGQGLSVGHLVNRLLKPSASTQKK